MRAARARAARNKRRQKEGRKEGRKEGWRGQVRRKPKRKNGSSTTPARQKSELLPAVGGFYAMSIPRFPRV